MKHIIVVFICAFLPQTSFAFSGGEVGNGGVGVACGQSVELFDLYEGQILNNNVPIEKTLPYQIQAQSFAAHLTEMTKDNGDEDFQLLFQYVLGSLKFLPSGVGLKLTDDSNNFIYPKNCSIVQILNYKTDGFIYVDSDLWNRLSETNKAAAILHESIYRYFRTPDPVLGNIVDGDQNSVRARRVVSHLIAGKVLTPVRELFHTEKNKMTWVCENRNQNEPSTSFSVYESLDKTTIEFSFLRGMNMITNSSITESWPFVQFGTVERVQSFVDGDTDVWIQNIGEKNKPEFAITIIQGNQRTKQLLDCRVPSFP